MAECTSETDTEECAICLSCFKQPKKINCGHKFCFLCLVKHVQKLAKNNLFSCPLCREEIKVPDGGVKEFTSAETEISHSGTNKKLIQQCDDCKCLDNAKVGCKNCSQVEQNSSGTSNETVPICSDKALHGMGRIPGSISSNVSSVSQGTTSLNIASSSVDTFNSNVGPVVKATFNLNDIFMNERCEGPRVSINGLMWYIEVEERSDKGVICVQLFLENALKPPYKSTKGSCSCIFKLDNRLDDGNSVVKQRDVKFLIRQISRIRKEEVEWNLLKDPHNGFQDIDHNFTIQYKILTIDI
ncbi:hypothetical protein SNE40_020621 [Patella caerulea]|uniref:RING-type domain-containing protein n=1 Tax=Patella caerulea TaxID=87958 RepID=A0AAN8J4S1_PATCE